MNEEQAARWNAKSSEQQFINMLEKEYNQAPRVAQAILADAENCLLDQAFIKDDSKSVGDLLSELISKLGENIKVARFSRFQIGQ